MKEIKKVNVFFTGPPGSGKSTVVKKIIVTLSDKGYRIGGIVSPEVRERGSRKGFLIKDLLTGDQDYMALAGLKTGVRVGKYGVLKENIERIGVKAIKEAVEGADVIVIDEVGKMELTVESFCEAIIEAIDSRKPVIGTVGEKVKHKVKDYILSRKETELIRISRREVEKPYLAAMKALGLA